MNEWLDKHYSDHPLNLYLSNWHTYSMVGLCVCVAYDQTVWSSVPGESVEK